MDIKIGMPYLVSNRYKKTFQEIEEYVKDNERITREVVWRSGDMLIRPQDQDEVDILFNALDEDEDEFCFENFIDIEFGSTWDCCEEVWSSNENPNLQEEVYAFYADELLCEEHFDFATYLTDELEYDYPECSTTIYGPIDIEKYDHPGME